MNKHLGIPLEKMEIIQLGVNHNQFTPADNKNEIRKKIISKFEIPTKNYFIHISETNYARKNIFRLLDAFEDARKKGIPQKLVLIGNLHKEVKARLKNYPNVLSLGYVSYADLVELIQGSDALVLPSIHEGFGIPLIESMACGVPCITSDRHTPPEVVGDAGLLVDPYDVSDIANKMIEISDADTLQTLSKRALQRSQDYSWKTNAAKILELYEKHTVFTGKWDFQKAYDIAAYQTVTTTCLLFANEERGVFVQSLLRSDYSKITQYASEIIRWALEYGLNDPKSRDFLVPFKDWIEQQSKKYEVSKLTNQEKKIKQSQKILTKEATELEILNNFLWNKIQYTQNSQISYDNENIKWLLEISKQHFLQSLQNKFEYNSEKSKVIKGLEQSKEEIKKYTNTALSEKSKVIKGLEQSKVEIKKYIETAINEKSNVIKGLEQSKEESVAYKQQLYSEVKSDLVQKIHPIKAEIDAIQNSRTFRIIRTFDQFTKKSKPLDNIEKIKEDTAEKLIQSNSQYVISKPKTMLVETPVRLTPKEKKIHITKTKNMRIGVVLDWNVNASSLMNIARNTFRELGELMNETKSFTISAIPLNSIKIGDINQHFDCIHIPNMGGYKFPYEESLRCKNLILSPIGIDEVIYGSEVFADKPLWKQQEPIIKKNIPMWKENITKISAVHVVAKSERAEMNKHLGIPLEKMKVIPHGINRSLFKPTLNKEETRKEILSKFQLPISEYFVHIGEHNWVRKNHLRLFDAYAEARKLGLKHQLIFVGKYANHIKKIGEQIQGVKFLGWVSDSHLANLLQGADAFLLPSIHEGFGMPLAEAMACGVPCITSDRHAPPEVIGDAGLLVDPYDVSDIANKMIEISDADTLQTLSKRALQRSQDYSWKTNVAEVLELYEKHTKFTGKWNFENEYEMAAFRTLSTTCLLFANEKRGIFIQSLLRFDYSKIIQWALEYGLNDPKSRDFLVPFKDWIEQQSKKINGENESN